MKGLGLYDRDGKAITMEEFSRLWHDMEYRRIGLDEVSPGITVSTVWLGIDHNWKDDGSWPIIFETAVITRGEFEITARYVTLGDALVGHGMTVAGLKVAAKN